MLALQPLSACDILHVWEEAHPLHPVDRALALLRYGCPEATTEELAGLSLGQRNARLLALHARTFGSRLSGVAACPQCSEQLEYSLDTTELAGSDHRHDGDRNELPELVSGGYRIRLRPPDSRDLAAVAGCQELASARSLLIERCVVAAWHAGEPWECTSRDLPEQLVADMAACLAEHDPRAELLLDLCCPECGEHWQLEFDIVSFLWEELCGSAESLLREVDTLARAYAWSEAEILSLSPARRRLYVEMTS